MPCTSVVVSNPASQQAHDAVYAVLQVRLAGMTYM